MYVCKQSVDHSVKPTIKVFGKKKLVDQDNISSHSAIYNLLKTEECLGPVKMAGGKPSDDLPSSLPCCYTSMCFFIIFVLEIPYVVSTLAQSRSWRIKQVWGQEVSCNWSKRSFKSILTLKMIFSSNLATLCSHTQIHWLAGL